MTQLPDFAAQTRRAASGDVEPVGGSLPRLYKTDLCRFYMRGTCANPACTFAHGPAELRKKPAFKERQPAVEASVEAVQVSPDDLIAAGQKLKDAGTTQVGQKLFTDLFKAPVPPPPAPRAQQQPPAWRQKEVIQGKMSASVSLLTQQRDRQSN